MADNTLDSRRVAKNTVVLYVRTIVTLFISLYTSRAILNILGVENYGVYNVVGGFVSMFALISNTLVSATQRYLNFELGKLKDNHSREVFSTSIAIHAFLCVVLFLLFETFGVWFLNVKLNIAPERMVAANWLFQFSIITFVLSIMRSPFDASIIAHERMTTFAYTNILEAVLKLAIVYCLLIPGNIDKLILYGFLMLMIHVLVFIIYWQYSKRNFEEINFKFVKDKSYYKGMLSFAGFNFVSAASVVFANQGVNILLNMFFGVVVNAARGVANQVNSGLQSMVGNMTTAVRPQVVQSYAAKDMDRTLKLTFSISKMSCSILYAMALPIMLEIDFILNIWLDGIVPEHTSSFLLLIVGISFISNLNSAVSGIIHASGKMMVYQTVTCAITLFSIPAGYIALKIGATAETVLTIVLICVGIGQCASLRIMKNVIDYKIKDYLKQVILPLILMIAITLPISATVHYFMDEGWMRLITVLVVSEICVGSVIYFIIMNANERALIKNLIHKKI